MVVAALGTQVEHYRVPAGELQVQGVVGGELLLEALLGDQVIGVEACEVLLVLVELLASRREEERAWSELPIVRDADEVAGALERVALALRLRTRGS